MNRLSQENSPYLLQHQHNPVDWHPWNNQALDLAKELDRPIFLSIGYAACHWCHVMERESFENAGTAALLNEHFISIKVDREERPDVDDIYMTAVVAMTGQGGWPLSVFLTPDGTPFYGGTYFPPERRHGMPSFPEVLLAVADAWASDRQNVLLSAEKIRASLSESLSAPAQLSELTLSSTDVDSIVHRLSQSYDWTLGGWGRAPKFPQPMLINFLLMRASKGDKLARDMATHALTAMAAGGMYDFVGGGFSRYSVDDSWLIPHFEKMLYDNAQLASAYMRGYMVTGVETYQQVARETLDFMLREMRTAEGGFVSSLDADSEGEEGLYYTWTTDEIKSLCLEHEFKTLQEIFGLDGPPNFEGKWVLRPRFRLISDASDVLLRFRKSAFQARQDRIRPATDDKVLLAWNAMAIVAFAEGARFFDSPEYLDAAKQCAEFVLAEMRSEAGYLRSYRAGISKIPAFLEDYAAIGLAFLTLYQTTFDDKWYAEACDVIDYVLKNFSTDSALFSDTSTRHDQLIARPRNVQDSATPSGNSMFALLLLRMNALSGNTDWKMAAENMLLLVYSMMSKYPTGFGIWLCALTYGTTPTTEVAILYDSNQVFSEKFPRNLSSSWRPFVELAASPFPPGESSPPLLHQRALQGNSIAIYPCRGFVCETPIFDLSELENLLGETR